MKININSEIGDLEGVIIHPPGSEVENMTPQNASRALYSDILNLSVASREYLQFKKILKKVTKVYEVSDLLKKVISEDNAKTELINNICKAAKVEFIADHLHSLSSDDLAKQLIEGVPIDKSHNLTNFLSTSRNVLKPLHNFFFTRDASISINNKILLGKLANKVREPEALIMESIFSSKQIFNTEIIDPSDIPVSEKATIEGGDILVARRDILIIGNSIRTSTQGIDFLIEYFKKTKTDINIIVQVLPKELESFIHLDMVFTLLDNDKCLIHAPSILNQHAYETVYISLKSGKVKNIREEKNILTALSKLGMKLDPILCGGNNDEWIQQREQWHSGANFFAIGPGKVIGYNRNEYTLEEMNKSGFEILKARDIINNKICIDDYKKYAITVDGAELARGGGGCRCMTMPVSRKLI